MLKGTRKAKAGKGKKMLYCYENEKTGEIAAGKKFREEALANGWKRIKKAEAIRKAKERNLFIIPIM